MTAAPGPEPAAKPAKTGPGAGFGVHEGPLRFPAQLTGRVTELEKIAWEGDSNLYRGLLSDRPVVVKVMTVPEAIDEWAEICALWQSCDPRFVVPLIEYGRTDQPPTVYEITEYAPDGSLHDLLESNRTLSEPEVRLLLRQAATILHHLHEGLRQPVMHRDVKPANFLVDASARPRPMLRIRITDFGSAMRYPPAEGVRELGFTRAYGAPEMFRPHSQPVSDWWSLGVMLQEIVLRRHPFRDDFEDDRRLADRMSEKTPPALDDIPPVWRDPVSGLWQRDLEHRWRFANVDAWLRGEKQPVHRQTGPDEAPGAAFHFAGRTVRKLSELAAAMGENWQEAAGLLIGDRWPALLDWCRTLSEGAAKDLTSIVDLVRLPGLDTERPRIDLLVTEVIARLSPSARPTFRRHEVTPENLAEMARSARHGDPDAVSFVASLYRSRALSALSEHVEGSALRRIHDEWQFWYQKGQLLAARHVNAAEQVPEEERFLALLLEAAADPDGRNRLAERAALCLNRRTRRVGWYRALFDDAVDENAPAHHAFMIVTEKLVSKPELRITREARAYAQEQYRIFLERPPRPGGRAPKRRPRTGPGRFGAVAVTGRTPPWWRRLGGRFGRLTPLLAYLIFAAVAGAGVADGTTDRQGVLVGTVLALAGVMFTVALSAPVNRMSNAVLGAGLGCLGGLFLGAAGAVMVNGFGGPAAAWPTFWTTWVAATAATGIAGAAE
ncbi:protein kinase [Actinoplanes sp. NPDC049596]|uniref:serine/threonine-protein kinase n=1 Tax=unclassified Actinoplanes TaxID=2626549 RepID=UPI00342EEBF5